MWAIYFPHLSDNSTVWRLCWKKGIRCYGNIDQDTAETTDEVSLPPLFLNSVCSGTVSLVTPTLFALGQKTTENM